MKQFQRVCISVFSLLFLQCGSMYGQGTIELTYSSATILSGGTAFSFQIFGKGSTDYVGPNDNLWTSLQPKFDVSVPAGVTLSTGTAVTNTTYVDFTNGVALSIQGTPPPGSREFGVNMTRLGSQPDLPTGSPVLLATVTLTVSGGTVVGTNIVTPRPFTGANSGSNWNNAASPVNRAINHTNPTFPLPIELLGFEAKRDQNRVLLSWETASEENVSHFEVERSLDGRVWDVVVARVEAQRGGVVRQDRSYSTYDEQPRDGFNYYRLKSVDWDGKVSYSGVKRVEFEGLDVKVYPTENDEGDLYVNIPKSIDGVKVWLSDLSGRRMRLEEEGQGPRAERKYSIRHLPAGLYLVHVQVGGLEKVVKVQYKP